MKRIFNATFPVRVPNALIVQHKVEFIYLDAQLEGQYCTVSTQGGLMVIFFLVMDDETVRDAAHRTLTAVLPQEMHPHAAPKAALKALIQMLDRENAQDTVVVNAMTPCPILVSYN